MGLLNRLADNKSPSSLANRFRRRRFTLFKSLIAPLPRPLRILDVGGTESFWEQMGCSASDELEITLLNLQAEPVRLPFVRSLSGDARDLSAFGDQSFDVVFSNSVIEHVGDRPDQRRMADEVRRVGRRYFVQTPARSFPIEPHFLFPFFGALPDSVRVFLVRRLDLGWYKKIPDRAAAVEFLRGFQLLNRRELLELFPGSALEREKLCGLTKSYIVHAGFPPTEAQ